VPTAIDHQKAEEAELARLLVETLHLDIPPESIDPAMPLFGDELGLDSIDALELALAISRAYGVEIKSDDARNKEIFASLRSLAGYIAEHRIR
jgi:acyl carrier protein